MISSVSFNLLSVFSSSRKKIRRVVINVQSKLFEIDTLAKNDENEDIEKIK